MTNDLLKAARLATDPVNIVRPLNDAQPGVIITHAAYKALREAVAKETETTFAFTMTRALTTKEMADLLTTAFEGGIQYWAQEISTGHTPAQARCPDKTLVWYAQPQFYDGDFLFWIRHSHPSDAGENPVKTDIDHRKLEEGLQRMAQSDGHVRCLLNILDGDYDAEDADVFMQFVLFGEVVFG